MINPTPITSRKEFRLRQPNFPLHNRTSLFLDDVVSGNLYSLTRIGLPQYDVPRHSIDRPSSQFAPPSVKVWIRHCNLFISVNSRYPLRDIFKLNNTYYNDIMINTSVAKLCNDFPISFPSMSRLFK